MKLITFSSSQLTFSVISDTHTHTTQRGGVAGQIIYNSKSALRAHMYKLYRQLS